MCIECDHWKDEDESRSWRRVHANRTDAEMWHIFECYRVIWVFSFISNWLISTTLPLRQDGLDESCWLCIFSVTCDGIWRWISAKIELVSVDIQQVECKDRFHLHLWTWRDQKKIVIRNVSTILFGYVRKKPAKCLQMQNLLRLYTDINNTFFFYSFWGHVL